MKIIRNIGIVILILVVVFIAGKNVIVKAAVTTGVKAVTGLDMSIKKMDIGLVNTFIGIKELKLYNPKGFVDPVMVDMPEVYVNYDLGAFLKKEVHLEEVRLHLKEIVVAKNKDGKLNLDSLKAVQGDKKKEEASKPKKEKTKEEKVKSKIQIDKLKLKIGMVKTKDYSAGGEPVINEYNINIDETFENITDPNEVVNIVLKKVLPKLSAQFLKNSIVGGVEGMLKESKELAGDTVKDALDLGKDVGGTAMETIKNTADTFKKLLPLQRRK